MKLKILISITLLLVFGESHAECIAKVYDQSKAVIINKENAVSKNFTITVSKPDRNEEDFYVIGIVFPKKYDENFTYAFSKALFSKNRKRLLSYNPEDSSFGSSKDAEIYIAANSELISCLSLVNIYGHNKLKGECSPTKSITIDLSGFIKTNAKCPKLNADNYY